MQRNAFIGYFNGCLARGDRPLCKRLPRPARRSLDKYELTWFTVDQLQCSDTCGLVWKSNFNVFFTTRVNIFGHYCWPSSWPLDAKASPSSWLTLAVGADSELFQAANEESRLRGLYSENYQTAASCLHHGPWTHCPIILHQSFVCAF